MNKWFFVVLVAAALLATGCTQFKGIGVQGIGMSSTLQMQRGDYEIIGPTKATACVERYALWPLPIFWTTESFNEQGEIYGSFVFSKAVRAAQYKAITQVPEADGIIAPQIYEEGQTKGIWYKKSCVTVSGKAIKIKVDKAVELPAAPAPAASPSDKAAKPAKAKKAVDEDEDDEEEEEEEDED